MDTQWRSRENIWLTVIFSSQYTAAAKQGALDPTARAISSLYQILKTDTKLPQILLAPMLSDTDKSQIIAELEKHTGGADKTGTVKNFLQALGENNRLGLLEGVCEKFGTLMSAARGEVELVVTSASVCLRKMLVIITLFYQCSSGRC